MFRSVLFSAAFSLLAATIGYAREGNDTGNGGGVVRKGNAYIPADLVYVQPEGYQVPSDHQLLDLQKYPEVQKELVLMMKIGSNRIRPLRPLGTFEIYLTPKLTGNGNCSLQSLNAEQIGYAFQYTRLTPDRKSQVHRAIEIKEDLFGKLNSPRDQALVIFHEVLHHELVDGGLMSLRFESVDPHSVISPLVLGTNILTRLYREQQAGIVNPVSQSDYLKLITYQSFRQKYRTFTISRKTGAAVYLNVNEAEGGFIEEEKSIGLDSNFVDASSVVDFRSELGFGKGTGNKIVNFSNVKIGVRRIDDVLLDNYISDSSIYLGNPEPTGNPTICRSNRIVNSKVFVSCENSESNLLENVKSLDSEDYSAINLVHAKNNQARDLNLVKSLIVISGEETALESSKFDFVDLKLQEVEILKSTLTTIAESLIADGARFESVHLGCGWDTPNNMTVRGARVLNSQMCALSTLAPIRIENVNLKTSYLRTAYPTKTGPNVPVLSNLTVEGRRTFEYVPASPMLDFKGDIVKFGGFFDSKKDKAVKFKSIEELHKAAGKK